MHLRKLNKIQAQVTMFDTNTSPKLIYQKQLKNFIIISLQFRTIDLHECLKSSVPDLSILDSHPYWERNSTLSSMFLPSGIKQTEDNHIENQLQPNSSYWDRSTHSTPHPHTHYSKMQNTSKLPLEHEHPLYSLIT